MNKDQLRRLIMLVDTKKAADPISVWMAETARPLLNNIVVLELEVIRLNRLVREIKGVPL